MHSALVCRFANAKSKAEVDGLVDEFLAAVDTRSDEELRARGWPKSMYGEWRAHQRGLGQGVAGPHL
jgi:hypothetical protein